MHSHQYYFVDFFGDNLFVTQTETPSVIRRWIRYVVYRHRRSRSRTSHSRRWSRRPVDTAMVFLSAEGLLPSRRYSPVMRGNFMSHHPALLL
ncbi:hypothetical protein HID58_003476 [Brassica napus]|uniref:Uncharacterized protein n=1 Tax=Brassica napus TaxID=3708 RepID=A0ABQ8EQK4_BRANA|nr:hypothetical protein HID58_003476 [Brassica napus]